MRTFGIAVLTLSLAAAISVPAHAQAFRSRSLGVGGGYMLLTNKSVQQEIKLDDAQAAKITKFVEEATARMREKVIAMEPVSFPPSPMAYACEFSADGRAFPARFELQEVKTGLADELSRRQRMGEIALGGEVVQIRSVHTIEGSPFEMASPIGYVFEQKGRAVGAVELNGQPRLILADPANEGLARTLTIAAMALALLRDPANSPLGD